MSKLPNPKYIWGRHVLSSVTLTLLLLAATSAYAVKVFKVSNYGGSRRRIEPFLVSLTLLFLSISWAMAGGKIVMVCAAVPLGAEDGLIAEHIEKLGFKVEPHAHDEKHPVDLSGVDGVFIAESTSSANITSAYKSAIVPVINAETYTYDDMGFAPDGSFNSDPDDTLIIKDRNHPNMSPKFLFIIFYS
jgi:hypothetical protein